MKMTKTFYTLLTLCSLTLFAIGCGETPNAADSGAGESSSTGDSGEGEAAADLGDATGEPPAQDEPFTEDGVEAGSEVEPFDEDGGPELPAPN